MHRASFYNCLSEVCSHREVYTEKSVSTLNNYLIFKCAVVGQYSPTERYSKKNKKYLIFRKQFFLTFVKRGTWGNMSEDYKEEEREQYTLSSLIGGGVTEVQFDLHLCTHCIISTNYETVKYFLLLQKQYMHSCIAMQFICS